MLKMDYNYNGAIIQNCYFKIIDLSVKRVGDDSWIYPKIYIFPNVESAITGTGPTIPNIMPKFSAVVTMEQLKEKDIYTIAYEFLKTLPEYKDAIDFYPQE